MSVGERKITTGEISGSVRHDMKHSTVNTSSAADVLNVYLFIRFCRGNDEVCILR